MATNTQGPEIKDLQIKASLVLKNSVTDLTCIQRLVTQLTLDVKDCGARPTRSLLASPEKTAAQTSEVISILLTELAGSQSGVAKPDFESRENQYRLEVWTELIFFPFFSEQILVCSVTLLA